MEVLRSGYFSHNLSGKDLAEGLRKQEVQRRNKPGLITCFGLIGQSDVLRTIVSLTKLDIFGEIEDDFPYPQLFIGENFVAAAGKTKLFEVYPTYLEQKITVDAGSTWDCIISHDYAYFSNGTVAVVRHPDTKEYSETTELPTAMTICNFNGQVIVGAPDAGYYS